MITLSKSPPYLKKKGRPPVKFVILFHPRSGSSWLRSMLAANESVTMGHEILAKNRAPGQQVRKFYDFYGPKRPASIKAIGAKVAPYQISNKIEIADTISSLNIRPVIVSRRSTVRTSISQLRRAQLAQREKKAGREAISNLRADVEPLGSQRIDPNAVIDQLFRDTKEKGNLELLARYLGRPYRIYYEDMLADQKSEIGRLGKFLNVSFDYHGDGRVKKNTSDDLSVDVSNLDEVRAAIEDSGFEYDA